MLSSDDSSAVELSELSNTTRPRFRSRHQSPHSFPFPRGPEVLFPRRARELW